MPLSYRDIREQFERAIRQQEELLRAQFERIGPSLVVTPHIAPNRWYHILPSGEYVEGQTQPEANDEAARPLSLADLESVRTMTYRPVRMADLYHRYSGPEGQPESAAQPQQGGQMRISTQPDPLTAEERWQVRQFFVGALTNGYAAWPFERGKIAVYIDGSPRRIYADTRWGLGEDYIYIGRSRDEGVNGLESPSNRLACIVALMGACEMQNDTELIALVEKRLAKVLAGVYESAIAPLAQRSNKEPIARIAWSPAGGVAAWVDGKWASPITGEEVTLKAEEGWVVVETGEGKAVEPEPPLPVAPTVTASEAEAAFRRFVSNYGWATEVLPDGRIWTDYSTEARTRERVQRAARDGYPGLLVEQQPDSGRWGITYPLAAPATESAESRFRQWATVWSTVPTTDGRPSVSTGDTEQNTREWLESLQPRLAGCVVERDEMGGWAITYPRVEVPTVPEGRVLLREDFDRWIVLHRFILSESLDGRPVVAYGGASRQYVEQSYLPNAIREGGTQVELAQNSRGEWGIAPVWGPAPVTASQATEATLLAFAEIHNYTMEYLADGRRLIPYGTEDATRALRDRAETEGFPGFIVARRSQPHDYGFGITYPN